MTHIVHAAALILMSKVNVVTGRIAAPGTNTVHRLGTLLSGALLKLVGIHALISVVGRLD